MLFKSNLIKTLILLLKTQLQLYTKIKQNQKKEKEEDSAFVNRLRHNQKVYFGARDRGFQERRLKAVAKKPSTSSKQIGRITKKIMTYD